MKKMMRNRKQPVIKKQSGQTMVFGLVFIVVILVGMIILFNTGQLTRQKMEVQNAADAAAYSAAILAARELNFMACTNRAMVANQVTLGQFAAFASWGKKYELGSLRLTLGYVQLWLALLPVTAVDSGSTYSTISNLIAIFLKGANALNKRIVDGMNIFGNIANSYIPFMQKLYTLHQKVLTVGTLAAQMDAIPGIIEDNAQGAQISNFGALATFLAATEMNVLSTSPKRKTFLKLNNDKTGRRRFAAFVNDSRDGWTRDRRRSLGVSLKSKPPKFGFFQISTNGFLGFKNIRGGTELRFLGSNEDYNWSTLDTVEGQFTLGINIKLCLPKPIDKCYNIGFPEFGLTGLNFSGAAAEFTKKGGPVLDRNVPRWQKAPYGKAWADTGSSARDAIRAGYQNQLLNKGMYKYRGLPDYIDINEREYPAVDTAPTFIVSVRKNGDILQTSDEIDSLNEGKLAVSTKLAGGRDGYGKTTEGDPANILRNKINDMVDAFRDSLLKNSEKVPYDLGQAAIEALVKQFENEIKSKVDELQEMLNKSLPNTAAKKGGVFAIAAAEVYFENPAATAAGVKASTFSPYWQVRLRPVDNVILRWSAITQGLQLDAPAKTNVEEKHFEDLSILAQ